MENNCRWTRLKLRTFAIIHSSKYVIVFNGFKIIIIHSIQFNRVNLRSIGRVNNLQKWKFCRLNIETPFDHTNCKCLHFWPELRVKLNDSIGGNPSQISSFIYCSLWFEKWCVWQWGIFMSSVLPKAEFTCFCWNQYFYEPKNHRSESTLRKENLQFSKFFFIVVFEDFRFFSCDSWNWFFPL